MSTSLTVLNNNSSLALGGLGRNSRLFSVKPAILEVVQSSSKKTGVTPGKLRITSSNQHLDSMQVVLLVDPVEQREKYNDSQTFSKENKVCFSLDCVAPHPAVKEPLAMACATCKHGDINWEKWRKDKRPANLPSCKKYWHLVVADRATKMIYYLNVRGTGISHFESQMQDLARLLVLQETNVRAENRAIEEANAKLAEGVEKTELKPLPNIFDVTFTISVVQPKQGGAFALNSSNFTLIRPEDRKDFGNLFLEFVNKRNQGGASVEEAEADEANAAVEAAISDAPSGPVQGVVVGKEEPITI